MTRQATMTRKSGKAGTKEYLNALELEKLESAFRQWAGEPGPRGSELTRARMLLMFLLIRYTGSKLSEVLQLDPDRDIDTGKGTVTFRGIGKSGKAREVEISQALAAEAGTLLRLLRCEPGRAFAVDPSFVRRIFYGRAEECGLDPGCAGPEMIRKARAIELMQNKLPLPAVQRLFGRLAPNPALRRASFSDEEMHRLTRLYLDREAGEKTSARNSFFGKVRDLSRGEVQTLVTMLATDGEPLYAMITNASASRLGLTPGMLVTAEVKAPWLVLEDADRSGASSVDNAREGTIVSVTQGVVNVECLVETAGGVELAAVVSAPGFHRLGVGTGDAVRVLFSAYTVILKVE